MITCRPMPRGRADRRCRASKSFSLLCSAAISLGAVFSATRAAAEDPANAPVEEVTESSPTDPQVLLEDIERQVAAYNSELEQVRARRDQLSRDLQTTRAAAEQVAREIRAIEAQLKEKRLAQASLQEAIAEKDKQILQLRQQALSRVRALYQFRSQRLLEGMLRPAGMMPGKQPPMSFSQASYLFAAVRDFDRRIMTDLEAAQEDRREQGVLLEQVVADRAGLLGQQEKRKADLASKISAKAAVAQGVAQEERRIEQVLGTLRAEALRIETVIASLTGQDGVENHADVREAAMGQSFNSPASSDLKEEASTRASLGPRAAERGERGAAKVSGAPREESRLPGAESRAGLSGAIGSAPVSPEPYQGIGLREQRKRLVLPARGTVVRGFGRQKHGEFADFVFQRGVEMAVPSDLSTQAVASGRVAFSGELPGFGKVVIIDHGKRSYSLYGRLQEVFVKPGQDVEKGQAIANLAASDRRGSNFYFEVRENGSPVNPRVFFPNL